MYLYIVLIILFFLIAYLFLSKKVSPIPYFPSNKKDLPLILKALDLKNNQTVVDLGAGGGLVVFHAATWALQRKLNTKFIAVELNPVLVGILHIRRLFHPNRKNILIIYADILGSEDTNFSRHGEGAGTSTTTKQKNLASNELTFYTYISPWFMEKVFRSLKKKYPRFRLVSYFYSLPKILKKPVQSYHGIHSVFTYRQGSSHI